MLAIVIPYYKRIFFETTLISLANQTNKNFAVYIGDDASLENPKNLLEKYKNRFTYNYKRFNSNLGQISLIKQWERCLKMVGEEEWVMILGDDDVLGSTVIEMFYKQFREIKKAQANVVRYASQIIDKNGTIISNEYLHPKIELPFEFLIRKFKGGTRSSLSEYIFKKEKIVNIKFKDFPLAWSSDTLGVIEFSDYKNIYTINSALVYFRLSGINITSQSDSIEKNNAKFKFYTYLLLNYGKQYPRALVGMLFNRLEKVQLNNKKTPFRWAKLFWLYIVFNQYSRFLSILVKIKKSIQ